MLVVAKPASYALATSRRCLEAVERAILYMTLYSVSTSNKRKDIIDFDSQSAQYQRRQISGLGNMTMLLSRL